MSSSDSTSSPEPEGLTFVIVFVLDDRDIGLRLSAVDRVEQMVEARPLPAAPSGVTGTIDFGGELIPLLDVRQRLRFPARTLRAGDSIIIAHTKRRRVALPVDAVVGVMSLDREAIITADAVVPGLEFVSGITRVPGRNLVVIHDLDRFLSPDEERVVDSALADAS